MLKRSTARVRGCGRAVEPGSQLRDEGTRFSEVGDGLSRDFANYDLVRGLRSIEEIAESPSYPSRRRSTADRTALSTSSGVKLFRLDKRRR